MKNLSDIYSLMSQDQFKDMLYAVKYDNNELFFTLYDNAPPHLIPEFKKDDHFTTRFCARIEGIKDNNIFNDWFFNKGLEEFYDVYEVRKLADKRPDNKELAQILKEKETPKSIVEILSAVFYYRPRETKKYCQLLETHKSKLETLNSKKFSPKSAIMENLLSYLKKFKTNEKLEVLTELHLDIFKINENYGKRLYLFDIKESSLEVIKLVDSKTYNSKNSFASNYDSFNSLFNFCDFHQFNLIGRVIEILENKKDSERLDKAQFVFSKLDKVFKEKRVNLKEDLLYVLQNMHTNNEENKKEVLNKSQNLIQKFNVINAYIIKNFLEKLKMHREDLFACINPLYNKLNKSLPESSIENRKIKI